MAIYIPVVWPGAFEHSAYLFAADGVFSARPVTPYRFEAMDISPEDLLLLMEIFAPTP